MITPKTFYTVVKTVVFVATIVLTFYGYDWKLYILFFLLWYNINLEQREKRGEI
jgi:hypothetical protein